jgi:hypothetical protein
MIDGLSAGLTAALHVQTPKLELGSLHFETPRLELGAPAGSVSLRTRCGRAWRVNGVRLSAPRTRLMPWLHDVHSVLQMLLECTARALFATMWCTMATGTHRLPDDAHLVLGC